MNKLRFITHLLVALFVAFIPTDGQAVAAKETASSQKPVASSNLRDYVEVVEVNKISPALSPKPAKAISASGTDNVCLEGAKKSGGKVSVYVRLSTQEAFICQDKNIVYRAKVFTGRGQYPTPVGDFQILNKAKDVYFGCDPGEKPRWWINKVAKCYHSNYWIGVGFYPGTKSTFGFHDADWWSEKQWNDRVNLNQYKKIGSHGCMNTYPNETPIFHKKLNVGNWVLIRQN